MVIVTEDLTGKNPAEKVTFGGVIKAHMSPNSNFPDDATVMGILNTATSNLKTATDANDVAAIKIAEPKFDLAIKGVVLHIQGVLLPVEDENVQKSMVASSGFGWRKQGEIHIHDLEAFQGEEALSVKIRSKASTIAHRVGYVFEISEDGVKYDFCKASLLATVHVFNLVSGKKYWFRVAVIVGETTFPFSDPTDIIVN